MSSPKRVGIQWPGMDDVRREQERDMIEHPERWPNQDVLHLKRFIEGWTEQFGFLFAFRPAQMTLLVQLKDLDRNAPPRHIRYSDVNDLLDDGWVVD